ncbi:hypothetical protein LguiB_010997 [Lonicera macranthoides]
MEETTLRAYGFYLGDYIDRQYLHKEDDEDEDEDENGAHLGNMIGESGGGGGRDIFKTRSNTRLRNESMGSNDGPDIYGNKREMGGDCEKETVKSRGREDKIKEQNERKDVDTALGMAHAPLIPNILDSFRDSNSSLLTLSHLTKANFADLTKNNHFHNYVEAGRRNGVGDDKSIPNYMNSSFTKWARDLVKWLKRGDVDRYGFATVVSSIKAR